ncbi:MAG TPA: hypothetical protein VNG93_02360 [Candidatus Dormibacteraeota bacterium]|nr:hypothetical protein [Candidatus Dormibacteraeota bacterium]
MAEDFTELAGAEIERRMEDLRARMRPIELDLDRLRGERDQLATELRRRRRLAEMGARRDLKEAMRSGELPTIAELVAVTTEGSFDDYVFNVKTGGVVRLGFPGARSQTIAFTDGRQVAQAKDLAEAARYHAAGWEAGAPGKPGVRVHFPGTRTERLVGADEVFVSPSNPAPG